MFHGKSQETHQGNRLCRVAVGTWSWRGVRHGRVPDTQIRGLACLSHRHRSDTNELRHVFSDTRGQPDVPDMGFCNVPIHECRIDASFSS